MSHYRAHLSVARTTLLFGIAAVFALTLCSQRAVATTPLEAERLVLRFADNLLIATPTVIGGYIEIETAAGRDTLTTIPGVLLLEHLMSTVPTGSRKVEGPYLVHIMSTAMSTMQMPMERLPSCVEYLELPMGAIDVSGESVAALFPSPTKDFFCPHQRHFHRPVTGQPTLVGEICTYQSVPADHDMDLPQAWKITQGAGDVLVAIVDTGFDWMHPELGGDGPPSACTPAESLLYFNNGVIYTNTNEMFGDADANGRPGKEDWDDDGDGLKDEDSLGRDWRNDAESDVYVGTVDSINGLTLTDTAATWVDGELVDRWLYLLGGSITALRVRIEANDETSLTTDPVDVYGIPFYDLTPFFASNSTFRVGDGLNNHEQFRDKDRDDEGWLGDLTDDDDENGAEDDFHGYDWLNLADWQVGLLAPCAGEDYQHADNNVFAQNSHGTALASLVATTLNEGRMVGVAPGVKILPVRIGYGQSASGGCDSTQQVNTLDLVVAMEYVRTFRPDVVVCAMGSGTVMAWSPETEAIQAVVDSGAVFINSAGNDDERRLSHWVESVVPSVIVAGVDQNDQRWTVDDDEGSNVGTWVDISARAGGDNFVIAKPMLNGNPRYDWWSGTSLSSPIVGGVAALVKSAYPAMRRDDIIWMLKRGVDDIYDENPELAEDQELGTGRVNAYRALTLYGNVATAGDTTWTNALWVGGDILVPSGRSLTLVPGTTVNVAIDDLLSTGNDSTGIEFVVNGELHIQGAPGNPVTFRVFEDDGATTEYVVNTTVSASTFTMDSLPAQCAIAARYPIASGSTDTTTVFAVDVMAGAAVDSVKVDLSDLGASGFAALRDDGEGEDSAAADGVYTSGRFQANVSAGTHDVDVVSWVDGGPEAHQDVVVEAVTNKAKFIDVSASTGDLYSLAPTDTTSTPYATVYFNTNPNGTSGEDLLVVTIDGDSSPPLLLVQSSIVNGGPGYDEYSDQWLEAALPVGSRGVAFADFDNDGDNDFFVCGVDSAVLFENRLEDTEGMFVNVTSGVFGASATDLAGSVAASWGDYNRDGFADLFVATTDYEGAVRDLTNPTTQQYTTLVFRNHGDGTFAETSFGGSGSSNVCLSGCWVDLDHDRDLELVTVQMDGDYPTVYDNTGFLYSAGDAQLVSGNWATTAEANGSSSVSVIDYNHDAYPDLLVTELGSPGRAVILKNDYDGTPNSKSFTAIELASGQVWNGAVVADFDLNGQEDYLLVPKSGEAALYMGTAYSTAPEYRDLAYTLGLRAGPASGAIAGDFNDDNDPDLYLGRLKSGQFQYKNVRQNAAGNDAPDAQQKWLAVQLETTGSSSGGLIGAEVSVYAGGQRWTQYVDGGSGRGEQRPGRLIFGLGEIAQSQVQLAVHYPSGEIDSTTVDVNQAYTWAEDASVALKAGTKQDPEPDFEFDLQPGSINWIFKWRSTNVRGDLRKDVVQVENYLGYALGAGCSIGISPNATHDLEWGDPGVSHSVYWDGSLWQHEVRWFGLPCYPWCEHRFKVTSSSGNGSEAESGLRTTTPTNLCLPDGIEE